MTIRSLPETMLVAALLLAAPHKVLGQDACLALLQHGLYDTYQGYGSSSSYHYIASEMCEAYEESQASSSGGGLSFKALGIDFSKKQITSLGKLLCEASTSASDVSALQTTYRQLINPAAVSAFESCVANYQANLRATTTRPDANTLVVDVTYRTADGADSLEARDLYSVEHDSTLSCSGPLWDLRANGAGEINSKTKGIRCVRNWEGVEPLSRDGRRILHPGGTLTIFTSSGSIVRNLGPLSEVTDEVVARVADLEASLAELAAELPYVVGDSLLAVSVEFHTHGDRKIAGVDSFTAAERRKIIPGVSAQEWRLVGSWIAPERSGFIKGVTDEAGDRKWAGGAFGVASRTIEENGRFYAVLDVANGYDNGDHGGFNLRFRHTALFAKSPPK